MLEDHQRAAMIANEPNVSWHHFVRSRFEARREHRKKGTSVAVEIERVELPSPVHADLTGIMEHASGGSLPVVVRFTGTLYLEARDVLIEPEQNRGASERYSGRFSENGRVLTLQLHSPGGAGPKQLHLVHEAPAKDLFG